MQGSLFFVVVVASRRLFKVSATCTTYLLKTSWVYYQAPYPSLLRSIRQRSRLFLDASRRST